MKKYVLSFFSIIFSGILFGQTILSPENPCPTISDIQFTIISTSGSNCTRTVSMRIKNDVSNSNPKGVKVEVLCDGVNVTSTNCFIASTAPGGAIFTTSAFTCLCSASPLIRITRYTASNGQCQGGTCGQVILITPISVLARVNCTNPRTYDLTIDAHHEDPLGTPAPISGTYETFIDDNQNGVIDAAEETNLKITASTAFTSSTSGAPAGFTSRFLQTGLVFDNGVIVTSELSDDPIIVRVFVTTLGVSGNETRGFNGCAGLPVSLKNFNANQRNGKVALSWETDQENNNDGFEVQRRSGSGRYETIGFVDSKAPGGTGGAYTYSFDDILSLPKGVSYYRIRQVDLDGKANYSEIKAIRTGGSNIIIAVYPNPSRGTTNVAIPEGAGKMDVSLDDYTGKSIQRWNGINVRNLQLTNLRPGIYMLRIKLHETGEQITERIMVQ